MKRRSPHEQLIGKGLAALALLGAAAAAQEAEAPAPQFQDIPIELARWIVPAANFLDSLPGDLAGYSPPPGIAVLGTLDFGSRQQIVLATDGSPPAQAQETLLRSVLQLPGWQELNSSATQLPLVFDAGGPQTSPGFNNIRLCHDGYGLLSILPSLANGLTAQRSWLPPLPASRSACDLLAASEPGAGDVLAQAIPRLIAPAGTSVRMSGMSMSRGWTRQTFLLNGQGLSLEALLEELGSQLRAQGWDMEASWAGELAAGARLRLPLQGADFVRGMLELVDHGEQHEISLTLSEEPRPAQGVPINDPAFGTR